MITKETGRPYNEKKDPVTQKIRFDGLEFFLVSQDYWNGPSSPEEKGQWLRGYDIQEKLLRTIRDS